MNNDSNSEWSPSVSVQTTRRYNTSNVTFEICKARKATLKESVRKVVIKFQIQFSGSQ
jgi:hypothetical protein